MTVANKKIPLRSCPAGMWVEVPSDEGFRWKEVKSWFMKMYPHLIEVTFADGSVQEFPPDFEVVMLSVNPEGIPNSPVIPEWDEYFLTVAKAVSTRAKCRRRQVGAVIVDQNHRIISTGYAGFPAGSKGDCLTGSCPRGLTRKGAIPPDSPYDDPSSIGYCPSIHAEQNAIFYAYRSLKDCTIYITDSPCPNCMKSLSGVGIARAVWPEGEVDPSIIYQ